MMCLSKVAKVTKLKIDVIIQDLPLEKIIQPFGCFRQCSFELEKPVNL